MSGFLAALPMYDWPEARAEVDAQWAAIRDRLRAAGVDAPEALTRDDATGGGLDLATLWRHPRLLLSQTCWGPMEAGLAAHVQVVGQQDYDGIEGGQGELYSSAIVMRRREAPPSGLPAISPSRGEIKLAAAPSPITDAAMREPASKPLISPFEGEMAGRPEGGNACRAPAIPLALLRGRRFAFSAPDSLSGFLALERDLAALGESLALFSARVETGSHRASIRAVAGGRADTAAIDCRSWAMARQFEPAARGLRVAGWTSRRSGLPFITARETPPEVVGVLRDVLEELG